MDDELESGFGDETQDSQPGDLPLGAASPSFDVNAIASALTPIIRREVERANQSGKDKRIGKLEGTVKSIMTEMRKLRELGYSEAQAEDLVMRTALLGLPQEEQPRPSVPAAPVQAVQPTPAVAKLQANPEIFGLDPNDVDVVELRRQGKSSVEDFYTLAEKKKASTPAPSAAAVQPTPGAPAPKPDLVAQYQQEIEQSRANPMAGAEARLQIRRKYRELGLNI